MILVAWVLAACLAGLSGDALVRHGRTTASTPLQLAGALLWVAQSTCWWVIFGRPEGFARAIATAAPVGVLLGVAIGVWWFGESMGARSWIGVVLAVAAVLVLSEPT